MNLASEDDRSVHVTPNYGPDHRVEDDGVCWCGPDHEDYREKGGKLLVIHRDLS
jgi:hypothetical protein